MVKAKAKDLSPKAKAKDWGPKAKAKAKDWGPKAKAKDSRSHKANVQRQYLKVKDDNDHKFHLFNS